MIEILFRNNMNVEIHLGVMLRFTIYSSSASAGINIYCSLASIQYWKTGFTSTNHKRKEFLRKELEMSPLSRETTYKCTNFGK